MKINSLLTDEGVLQALGSRIAALRVSRNLTQVALAEAAGVSRSTVERLEQGQSASSMAAFIRICRTLDLLDRLELLLPEPAASPLDLVKLQGRRRQRASPRQARKPEAATSGWTWKKP